MHPPFHDLRKSCRNQNLVKTALHCICCIFNICWYIVWMRLLALGKGWHYKCGWMLLPPTLALFCPIPAAWELYVSRPSFYDKKRHLCNHQVFVWATLLIIKSQNEIICIPTRVHTSYYIAYLLYLRAIYINVSGITDSTGECIEKLTLPYKYWIAKFWIYSAFAFFCILWQEFL